MPLLPQENAGFSEMPQLQKKAKALDLWALGHPREIGGQGLPFRDYIYVNEVMGRSEMGSVALGTHSLQDSLMLHNHASTMVKERYLDDLVAARVCANVPISTSRKHLRLGAHGVDQSRELETNAPRPPSKSR